MNGIVLSLIAFVLTLPSSAPLIQQPRDESCRYVPGMIDSDGPTPELTAVGIVGCISSAGKTCKENGDRLRLKNNTAPNTVTWDSFALGVRNQPLAPHEETLTLIPDASEKTRTQPVDVQVTVCL